MSTLKVDGIRSNSATSDAITLADNGTCTANITNNLSNRNLIINGAMQVAERSAGPLAVTEGTNEGYQTIDRIHFSFGNAAAGAANVSQSTDAPTTLGFTKSHKTDVTTVNTTASGSGSINLQYLIEGQDIRSSGWNHLSASSFLTLSFYFKTTKTGNLKLPIGFRTRHGTNYYYVQNVTITDPTNWNRYTVTIPGNSNLQIDDANTAGMSIFFSYYTGSNKDTSSEGSWSSTNASSTSDSTNFFDSTSNDMFITGVQLEASDHATSFEHRSFAVEKRLCMRYYQQYINLQISGGFVPSTSSKATQVTFTFPVEFRANPSASITNTGSSGGQYIYDGSGYQNITALDSAGLLSTTCHMNFSLSGDLTDTRTPTLGGSTNTSYQTTFKFNAEL